jgi:hypothetical protein
MSLPVPVAVCLTDRIQFRLQIIQRQFLRTAGFRFPHCSDSGFRQNKPEGYASRVDGLSIKEPNRLGGSQTDFPEDILRQLLISGHKPHIDTAESGTPGFRNARTHENTSFVKNNNAKGVTSQKIIGTPYLQAEK